MVRTNCGEYFIRACRNSVGPFTFVPSQIVADASIGTPPSPPCFVRQEPSASKFSNANPIGSISLWQPAQGSFLRCSVICSRRVITFFSLLLSSSGGTFGGGSGGGVPRIFSSTHTPRFTGDVRKFCCQASASTLPCPRSPRRYASSGPRATRRKCEP